MAAPLLEMEGTWEEIAARADELAGRRVKIIVISDETTPVADSSDSEHHWTAGELLKLSPAERGRILSRLAKQAEILYRNDPELTAFEAFGADDLYDETP